LNAAIIDCHRWIARRDRQSVTVTRAEARKRGEGGGITGKDNESGNSVLVNVRRDGSPLTFQFSFFFSGSGERETERERERERGGQSAPSPPLSCANAQPRLKEITLAARVEVIPRGG